MKRGRVVALVAGFALVGCLGVVGVAEASGVWDVRRCVGADATAVCAYVDENGDGVCDNRDAADVPCAGVSCDGSHEHAHLRAHDGTGLGDRACTRVHATGRCHGGR